VITRLRKKTKKNVVTKTAHTATKTQLMLVAKKIRQNAVKVILQNVAVKKELNLVKRALKTAAKPIAQNVIKKVRNVVTNTNRNLESRVKT
jgi:predicted transport protein